MSSISSEVQEEQWEVQEILDKRVTKKGKIEYKVLWVDYPEDQTTWEPEDGLRGCIELVRKFEDEIQKKNLKKQHNQKEKIEKNMQQQQLQVCKDKKDKENGLLNEQSKLSKIKKNKVSSKSNSPAAESEILSKRKQKDSSLINEELPTRKKVKEQQGHENEVQSASQKKSLEQELDQLIKDQQNKLKSSQKSNNNNNGNKSQKFKDINKIKKKEIENLQKITQKELENKLKKFKTDCTAAKKQVLQGHFIFGDKPEKIKSCYKNSTSGDIEFIVEWEKRPEGITPHETCFLNEDLKNYDPYLIIKHYESITKILPTANKQKNIGSDIIDNENLEENKQQKELVNKDNQDKNLAEFELGNIEEEVQKQKTYELEIENKEKQSQFLQDKKKQETLELQQEEENQQKQQLQNRIEQVEEIGSNKEKPANLQKEQQNQKTQDDEGSKNQKQVENNKDDNQVQSEVEEIKSEEKDQSKLKEVPQQKTNIQEKSATTQSFKPNQQIKKLIKRYVRMYFENKHQVSITPEVLHKSLKGLINENEIKEYLNVLADDKVLEEKEGHYSLKKKE